MTDVIQMMAALPDTAPAVPKQPRRVLVLAKAAGFVHATIPLAARTIEALGQKTGAWTTVITYNPADITAETPMLAHILAGVQYAIGDLQADDSPLPSSKKQAEICEGSAAH